MDAICKTDTHLCLYHITNWFFTALFLESETFTVLKFPFTNKCTLYLAYKMLKFTLKYLIFAPTCFGPPGPSSESLYRAWLKLHFCRINQ
jgi:hypothetical protein